ncbi:MAG: hypothetical protein RQ885_03100 [Desulfurococcales archaeon]|nr:hypothetical protein [Desulfurococcales archaeon]
MKPANVNENSAATLNEASAIILKTDLVEITLGYSLRNREESIREKYRSNSKEAMKAAESLRKVRREKIAGER